MLDVPDFDYNKAYDCAKRLIEKFGSTGTFTRTTLTIADPTKPWASTSTDTDYSLTMVVVPWSATDAKRYFSENLISETSKGIILWPDGEAPQVNDTITYKGESWIYKAGKKIKPAGTGIIYVAALAGPET